MRKSFSVKWIGSKQPRKQRKYIANAPFHIQRDMISGHLSKELRAKYGRRSFPVRKGDVVIVMSGEFKGKKGKVELFNSKNKKVSIEGIQITKKDGSKVSVYFSPSKLLITELILDDKRRSDSIKKQEIIERIGGKK
jgi:large subunit ribosomal protein L24